MIKTMKKTLLTIALVAAGFGCSTVTPTTDAKAQAREAEAFRVIQQAQQAIAVAQQPKSLPFILTLGTLDQTNQYGFEIIGNTIKLDNMTNAAAYYKVGSNIWMKLQQ